MDQVASSDGTYVGTSGDDYENKRQDQDPAGKRGDYLVGFLASEDINIRSGCT